MRFWILLGLSFVLVAAVSAKKQKHHKKNDWDGLEDLLRKVDQLDKKLMEEDEGTEKEKDHSERDEEAAHGVVESENPHKTKEKMPLKNPCESTVCGWGKECVVNTKGKPKCECIRECPRPTETDPFDRVCSNQNETFDSICHLYRERCLCKQNGNECQDERHSRAHLEYLGECRSLHKCTDELLDQFPARMADWLFQVMRDLKKRQELHGEEWMDMIDQAEHDDHVKHVYPVIWKFCDLDSKPHDKEVSHHELIPITAPVMPMESCIKPFLNRCDADKNDKISLKEWGKCLGLKDDEIIERC